MSGKIRLIWLTPEFTPYLDLFFAALAADGRFDLKVVVMMEPTKTHPFANNQERPYAWEMANPKLRVDRPLLLRILAEENAWFLVSSYFRPTLMAAMQAMARARRPFLYFTDTPLPQETVWNGRLPQKRSWPRRLARMMRLRWIFSHAYRVLATGNFGVNAINTLGCPSNKSVVFPHSVALLPPSPPREKPDKTIRLLGLGQLIYRKGWDLAIQALQQVRQLRPDLNVMLWLVGDGPDRSLLEEMVRTLQLEQYVSFLGWRHPPEIAEYFKQVDALIHPARWEPYGIVIMEAMSASLPILGSDATGAVVDRVTEGVSGWIHPAGDSAKLVLDIITLADYPERIPQMRIQAHNKALEWPASRGIETLHAIITEGMSSPDPSPRHKEENAIITEGMFSPDPSPRHKEEKNAPCVTRKIRLILVSAVIDPQLGGPATVLQRHLRALRNIGVEVTLFGVVDKERLPLMRQLYPGAQLFPTTHPKRWFRGTGLVSALKAAMPNCDVIHAHMLWDHPVWTAWRIARRAGKPLIVTPHGSLMESWRYRSLHKRLYRWLFVDPMLQETAFLHVLSHHEAFACRQAGVLTPLRMVPNGLEEEEFDSNRQSQSPIQQKQAQQARKQWPILANQQILLYLGRLWEGKGVTDLVDAWATLSHQSIACEWILVLAGPDYQGGRQRLEYRLKQLGIENRVLLTGPVFGTDKTDLLALASGFVLPSRSEGASMALLEAMAVGLGLVLTQECHFPELALAGGGIEVVMGVEGITNGLTQLLSMTPSARDQMGQKARSLAQSRFTMSQIAVELRAMYQDAIEKMP